LIVKDFPKTKNNFGNNNLNKIEESDHDYYENQSRDLAHYNIKDKDKELKELIFQESTSSKDMVKNNNKDSNNSKNKNKTIGNRSKEIDSSVIKQHCEKKKITDAANTEVENEMQASKINSNVKVEIEHLDEEIKELQNKLKTMIKSNKN